MSFQASAWAAKQRAGNPSAKAVLYGLANYAGFDGVCWPSQKTLADDTEQSIDSVQRRLKELEQRGLIYRPPQKRKKDSRNAGEFGSGMIVILMDDICLAAAMKYGYDPENPSVARVEDETAENQEFTPDAEPQIAARPEIETNEINALADTSQACGAADCGTAENGRRAADCGSSRTALLRYGIVNTEPSTPLKSPFTSPAAALADGSWLSDWERFVEAWRWATGELLEPVRQRFRELEPAERLLAIEHIAGYQAEIAKTSRKSMSARSWVSRKGWEPFVLAAKKHPTLTPGKLVPVIKDTPPWQAWLAERGARSFPTRRQMIGGKLCDVWDFPTLWPPRRAAHPPPGPEPNGTDFSNDLRI